MWRTGGSTCNWTLILIHNPGIEDEEKREQLERFEAIEEAKRIKVRGGI